MDNITIFTEQLKEDLLNITDIKAKKDVVYQFIARIEKEDQTLPDFPLGLDWFNVSQSLDTSMLDGKIVVLDFFTYCCINCLHIIPHLRKLEEKYTVTNGLVVIGVHSAKFENEKDSSKVLFALNRYNISHPVVNDKACFLWDKLNISCWPTILIISPKRKIIFALIGEGHQDELFFYVETALEYYQPLISSHLLPLDRSNKIITSSLLNFPSKIARYKNLFAVSDSGNHRIIVFEKNGQIKFIIGGKAAGLTDGNFQQAQFDSPQGVAFYNENKLFIADTENHAIRLACLEKLIVTTVVGNGHQGSDYIGGKTGISQEISSPWDICIVPCSHTEFSQTATTVRSIITTSERSSSLHFSDVPPPPLSGPIPPPPPPPSGQIPPPPPSPSGPILPSPPSGPLPPPPPLPKSHHSSTAFSFTSEKHEKNDKEPKSYVLLIAAAGTHQIWAYFIEEGVWWNGKKYNKNVCLAIAGTGKEENRNNRFPNLASFAQPSGLTYSAELNSVFIADSESSTIRRLSLIDGSVTHIVGGSRDPDNLFAYGDADGKSYDVKLQHPLAIAWDSRNKLLYVCDTYNHKIKMVEPTSKTCNSILKMSNLSFSEPSGCCVSEDGNFLYVCDTNNDEIKILDVDSNKVTKLELTEVSDSLVDHIDSKNTWKVETCLGKENSFLKLEVEFFPKEIHGKWKLVLNDANIKVENEKGNLDTNELSLNLEFPPSCHDPVCFQVAFDLVLCGTETCNLKKITLDVNVKRQEKGPTNGHAKLFKNLS